MENDVEDEITAPHFFMLLVSNRHSKPGYTKHWVRISHYTKALRPSCLCSCTKHESAKNLTSSPLLLVSWSHKNETHIQSVGCHAAESEIKLFCFTSKLLMELLEV